MNSESSIRRDGSSSRASMDIEDEDVAGEVGPEQREEIANHYGLSTDTSWMHCEWCFRTE